MLGLFKVLWRGESTFVYGELTRTINLPCFESK